MMADEFQVRLTKGVDLPVPKAIADWLGRALLLYGVPFSYLVPDERMLPPESIRFFHVDPAWVQSLLGGACSMGRGTARDEMVDEELSKSFLTSAAASGAQLRDAAVATSSNAGGQEPPTTLNWPLTGFLLRSAVVEAFIGLEVIAATGFDSQTQAPIGKLQALRIDRLAPDVLLCIYNGVLNFIEIKQPPEGLHFGASPSPAGGFEKLSVRRVNAPAGQQIPGPKEARPPGPFVDVPMRAGVKRVVSVKALATRLEAKLAERGALGPGPFTAAEFGLQMVESPGRVRFEAVETSSRG